MFRRRRRGSAGDDLNDDLNDDLPGSEPAPDAGSDDQSTPSDGVGEVGPTSGTASPGAAPGLSPRPDGPWDVTDVPDPEGERFDLGGIQLAIPDGAQVQLDVTPEGMVVPTLFVGEAAVQISAFAAPRRTGIWAEIRAEIAESLREAGGDVADAEGTFGAELHGQVPVQLEDGSIAFQPARFVGVDGPRWFLRGLFTGEAVVPGAAAALEAAFRGTVVVRGGDAMAPRDPLPVTVPRELLEAAGVPEDQLPAEAAGQDVAPDQPPLTPFERGPEITEVR